MSVSELGACGEERSACKDAFSGGQHHVLALARQPSLHPVEKLLSLLSSNASRPLDSQNITTRHTVGPGNIQLPPNKGGVSVFCVRLHISRLFEHNVLELYLPGWVFVHDPPGADGRLPQNTLLLKRNRKRRRP